jgi:hypothetical protein
VVGAGGDRGDRGGSGDSCVSCKCSYCTGVGVLAAVLMLNAGVLLCSRLMC